MFGLFDFFSTKNPAVTVGSSNLKESYALYNSLLEKTDAAQKILDSDTLVKLTNTAFYDFKSTEFIPPMDGKAQSAGSLFAFLCRYNTDVGLFVLRNKAFFALLHDDDIYMLHESEAGEELKAKIIQQHLEDEIDPRFKEGLYRAAARLVAC